MDRIKLKKKVKLKINCFYLVIMLFISLIFLTINYIGRNIYPILLAYGEIEAEKLATLVINKSITKNEIMNIDLDSLFIIKKDDNGKIITMDFNTIEANKLMLAISTKIQKNLKHLETGDIHKIEFIEELTDYKHFEKGIFYEIPLGVVTNNPLFSNSGPKIPIKFSVVGNISSRLENKIKSYGINSAMLEIILHIKLTEKIIIPFVSKKIIITEELPIALKIIQGDIPDYYLNSVTKILDIPVE